ncbi:NifC-like ABC-type porter [Methanococcus vannielii SB]|uniref:NifC-like ABC-type porter n=1 Tax=Methanococcus vannielii (strain ATCC 35089 / DSM 1224 / JCM 13029 / OCM 148 / SB) TaxID=406327 RepID=A6USN8_METVS|nr:ABC transporter permease [Methanococcus vannielii]ABR55510.1 NifC-like ABC-type porter [Methanococcus vannielii SB]
MKNNDFLKFFSFSSLLIFSLLIISIIMAIISNITAETLFSAILSKEIHFAIKLSVLTASIATIFGGILGIPTAYALARYEFKGKFLIDSLVELPIILPPLITGFALLVFFGSTEFGRFISENIIDVLFTPKGIVVAQFFVATPFIVRTSKSVFESIDEKYELIAQSLGSKRHESFINVILPMAKNGIFTGLILAWARSIGEFGATVMLAGATKMKTETLPIAVFLNISLGNFEKALAVSFIFLVVAITILSILKMIFNNGEKNDRF